MPTGNDCPACGENIGMWAVFKAPLPNRIYCPHCGERLRYGDTWGPLAAAVVLMVALIAAGGFLGLALGFDEPVLTGAVTIGFLLLGGVALEVVFVLLLWYGGY